MCCDNSIWFFSTNFISYLINSACSPITLYKLLTSNVTEMAAMLGMDASAFQMPKFDPNSVAQAADQTDAELVSLYVRLLCGCLLN